MVKLESEPKCGNCEEFASDCDCYDHDEDMLIIISWRIKHGFIETDCLESKIED